MSSLSSILALVDRKGEAVIVREDGQSYIVLPLESYQDLQVRIAASDDFYVDGWLSSTDAQNHENIPLLTKEQLVDKINRDIALWKSGQKGEFEEIGEDEMSGGSSSNEEDAEEQLYFEPISRETA